MVWIPRARRFGAALHHHRRPDRDQLVDVVVARQRLPDALGHQALDARRAVVGADDELIAAGAELVVPENQVLVAEADDADHVGAALLVGARLRIDRRHAEPAADADDFLRAADVARLAHRADQAEQVRAGAAVALHLARGLADRLDHQRDRAALAVEVRDGERNALALRVRHHDDELARLGGAGELGVQNLEQIGRLREILSFHDLKVRLLDGFGHFDTRCSATYPAPQRVNLSQINAQSAIRVNFAA